MRFVVWCLLIASAVVAGGAHAAPLNRLSAYGDWSLLGDAPDGPKLCFLTATPKASAPEGLNREPGRIYVSAWPLDGIRAELSLLLGFTARKTEAVTAVVGGASFALFSKDRRAFVEDPTQELKLLEAMKKGAKLVVSATSERGTAITDTYSLQGFQQAYQDLAEKCS